MLQNYSDSSNCLKMVCKLIAYFLLFSQMLFSFNLVTGSSKSSKAECFNRWQKDANCLLQQGHWVVGSTMNYTFMTALSKFSPNEQWGNCTHNEMPYVWESKKSCVKIAIKPAYSQRDRCRIVRGRNIMVVGDSISDEFFVTFASAAWQPKTIIDLADIVHLESFRFYNKTSRQHGKYIF